MSDSTSSSVTIDHLYVGEQPVQRSEGVTIAESQNLTRGSAIGKILYGAVTAEADAGNTGDGTCTVLSTVVGDVKPVVGAYNLECIEAVTNGGVFKLEDPNGGLVAGNLPMTAGAGTATAFEVAGLAFTLTDATTDFALADKFAVTVAAGSLQGKLVDKAAVDGSGELFGILTQDVTVAASTTEEAPVDKVGKFNTNVVTFASGTTYADVEADARLKGIYFGGTLY